MPLRRKLLIALAVVLAVPVILVAAMRLLRHRADDAVVVRGNLVRVRNFFTDVYGLRTGDKVLLFDAGVDGDGHPLDKLLAHFGKTRDDVEHVFLTHGHFDHVADSPLCRRATIHVGQADVDLLAKRVPAVRAAAVWFQRILPVGPVEANATFATLQVIALDDGKELLAIPTPGHTPGSYVYFYDGVLIAGDTLQINGDELEFAMPDFSDDHAANLQSIASLGKRLAGKQVDIVCTGHQGCTGAGAGGHMLDSLIRRAESEIPPALRGS